MSFFGLTRGGGKPRAKSRTVSSATGPLYTVSRLLGNSSTIALIAGTNANLTLDGLNIEATVAIPQGQSQVAVVREEEGLLAIEYSVTLTGAGPVIPFPGVIGDLAAVAASSTVIDLTWTAASNAVSHQYRRRLTVGPGAWGAWTATSSGTGHSVTGLTASTGYDFQVRGVNVRGNGPPSNIETEATSAAAVDTTPNAFDWGGPFTGEPNELFFSNEIEITNVTPGTPIPYSTSGGHGGCCGMQIQTGGVGAWSAQATSGNAYLGDKARLRTRAHETPGNSFVLTGTIGGVSDTIAVNTEAEGINPVAAPVIAQNTAEGFNPLGIGVNWGANNLRTPSEDDVPIDYVQHRHRANGGAWVYDDFIPVKKAFIANYLNDGVPIPCPNYLAAAPFANGTAVGRQVGVRRGRLPVVLFEGDSLTASGPNGFPSLYAAAHPENTYFNQAVGGNNIEHVEIRLSTTLARKPDICVLTIGANGIYPNAEAWAERVLLHCDDMTGSGIAVLLNGVLPIALPAGVNAPNVAAHNADRVIVNNIFAAAVGTRIAAYNGWATGGMMANADATNLDKYDDGVHPDTASEPSGHERLLTDLEPALNTLVAAVPAPAAIVWSNEVTDEMVVAAPTGVNLVLTPVAQADRGYSDALYSTLPQAFGAGRGVVLVASNNSAMSNMVLRPDGALDDTTDIALLKTDSLNVTANGRFEVWESAGNIAAGNYVIRVDPTIGAQYVRLYVGTLTGAVGGHLDRAVKVFAYSGPNNNATADPLVVADPDGLGIAMVFADFATDIVFDNGTELYVHPLGDGGNYVGIARYDATATPQADLAGNGNGCAILAVSWSDA